MTDAKVSKVLPGYFVKKPIFIRAFRLGYTAEPDWWLEALKDERAVTCVDGWRINTLEGVMSAKRGDWIILGVAGEIYSCKPEIFTRTYEPSPCP